LATKLKLGSDLTFEQCLTLSSAELAEHLGLVTVEAENLTPAERLALEQEDSQLPEIAPLAEGQIEAQATGRPMKQAKKKK
jgi:hypothetical protein